MDFIRQKDLGFLLCQACILLMSLLPIGQTIDNQLFDHGYASHIHSDTDDLVLISIDGKSLEALGRWPWPRSLHADMISLLQAAQVKALGYNVAFIEPDNRPDSADSQLKGAIASMGRVVLPVFAEDGRTVLPFRQQQPLSGSELGHVDIEVDTDGYVRRAFLKAGIDYPRWSAFGLLLLEHTDTARHFLPGTRHAFQQSVTRSKWVRDLQVLVPFSATGTNLPSYSFIDVRSGYVPTTRFRDKTVLVGIEAAGLEPTFMVPGAERTMLSGTRIHANLYNALRSATVLTPILPVWGLSYAVLLTALLYSVIFYFRRFILLRLALTFLVSGLIALPFLAIQLGYWLPLSASLAGVSAVILLAILDRLVRFEQGQRNDSITALANQRMFRETLAIEWERSQQKQLPLSLIILRVDFFTRFHDTFGPERSDWLLARIGPLLPLHKRHHRDLVARYGQDGFALLLPITPHAIALSIAEKLRKEVETLQIEHSGSGCADVITVSAGLVTVHSGYPLANSRCFLQQAENAVQQAQQYGGNRVVSAEQLRPL